MSDASEHLAPVSYLPWATPVESVPERSASPADEVPSAEGADPDDGAAPGGSHTRAADPASGIRAMRRVVPSVGAARFAIVADDPDETGPERDARIDRLVVSRLRRSALSVAEVRSVLAEHGLDEGEIEEWIERYERFGYLDDARLAEQLVHVNGARRGRGSGAILQELARRGVDASAARAAVDELDPEVERAQRPRGRRAAGTTAVRARPADRRAPALRVPPAARLSGRRRA